MLSARSVCVCVCVWVWSVVGTVCVGLVYRGDSVCVWGFGVCVLAGHLGSVRV